MSEGVTPSGLPPPQRISIFILLLRPLRKRLRFSRKLKRMPKRDPECFVVVDLFLNCFFVPRFVEQAVRGFCFAYLMFSGSQSNYCSVSNSLVCVYVDLFWLPSPERFILWMKISIHIRKIFILVP